MPDSDITALLDEAGGLIVRENYGDAHSVLTQACAQHPTHPDAWEMLGETQASMLDYSSAIGCFQRALSLDAGRVGLRAKLANLLSMTGRHPEALDVYREILARDPGDDAARLKMTGLLLQMGRHAEALPLLKDRVLSSPESAEAWSLLNMAYARQQEWNACLDFCSECTGKFPGNPHAWLSHGFALEQLGFEERALGSYLRAVQLAPGWPDALNRYGMICIYLERFDEASASFSRSLSCGGDSAVAHYGYALALRLKGNAETAEWHLRIALEKGPAITTIQVQLGKALSDQFRMDEAIDTYRSALEQDADCADAIVGLSEVYERMGEREEAFNILRPLLHGDTPYPDALCVFAKLSGSLGRRAEAVQQIEKALENPDLRLMQRMVLQFALGDLYDALDEPVRAMPCYQAANSLKPVYYDPVASAAFVDRLIGAFDTSLFARYSGAGDASDRPVFVVGMPRSGTSLVEQMLSMHGDVFAAGELNEVNLMAERLGLNYLQPDSVDDFSRGLVAEPLQSLAAEYLARIDSLAAGEPRVTDKMPTNFRWLGLIYLLFPRARIIHMQRNPLDTCLSCYSKDFSGVHEYAYDLENLGHYYTQYLRLMAHWHRVIGTPILDVSYEKLVQDPETVCRRIVAYCDLRWDDRVLDFHGSDRLVRTASYRQVNKPLYRTSIGRWKRYESFLEPLVRRLGDNCV